MASWRRPPGRLYNVWLNKVQEDANALPLSTLWRSEIARGHGTDTDRSTAYDFLLTFHSNHGPISYRFQDRRRFPSKTANFSHPVYFVPHWRGSSGNWVSALGVKKLESWGYRADIKGLTISSAVWIQYTNIHALSHWARAKIALMHSVVW